MKLTEITVRKGQENKLTIKGRTGSYKSDGAEGEVTLTFTLDEGEHLRSEEEMTREANDHVKQALSDLMDKDEAKWLQTTLTDDGYKESK